MDAYHWILRRFTSANFGGGGGGPAPEIPFNMAEMAPFMPSVFNGPYNAQGAYQNEQMIASKYPWITPPAGQFAGAQPGQFAGAGGGFPGAGISTPSSVQPPIPPTVPQGGNASAQFNPMALSSNQQNAMQPTSLQTIEAILGSQGTGGTSSSG